MVDEFSRFARLPDARLQPDDLNDVIVQAVSVFEGRFANINVELTDQLPQLLLDPEQLKRVFVNLSHTRALFFCSC